MTKNFKIALLLLLFSSIGIAQVPSQYQEQLDMLPESVRSSVFERINENDFSQADNQISILQETEDEDIEDEEDDLIKYDLFQKEYDRYGSLIPKPFGYELFQNYKRNNLTSVQSAPADYILGPGDELRINFSGSLKASRKVKIDREGNIFLRELGTLNFSGLSYQKTQEELDRIVEASLIGTEAAISLIKVRPIQIFVVGQSMRPGSYNLNALSSISTALFESGGPNVSGSLRNISLKRSNELIGALDLYELFIKGNSTANIKIQSGDVLLINPIKKQVEIFGEVNTEAIFELKEGENFKDLIVFASGFKPLADKSKIVLTRQATDNDIFVKEMSLAELKEFQLQSGDSIFVDRLSSVSVDANKSRRESVTLEGAFVNPGMYYLEDSEKLSELIERAG